MKQKVEPKILGCCSFA